MSLESVITAIGLPGIALGTVVEGETIAFLGGALSHRGYFPLALAILAASLGAMVADNLCFLLGRRAGQSPLAQRLLAKGPVQALSQRFHRHPILAIFGFRFIYGMKTAGAVLFGTTPTPWLRFLVLDAVACLIWSACFVSIGYASGHLLTRLMGVLALHWHLALALALIAALLLLLARGQRLWSRRLPPED